MTCMPAMTRPGCRDVEQESKIRELLAERFGADAASIDAQDHIVEKFYADSLELLDMCLALNTAFGIEIGPRELETIETVGDIYSVVAQLLGDMQGEKEELPYLTKDVVVSRLAAVRTMK